MGHNLLIAVRNLLQHKRRSFLLGGAIAGVTALLVFMLGLFGGIQDTLVESATTVMTGHVNVGGFYKVTAGASAPLVAKYEDIEKIVRDNVPELDFIAPRGRGWSKLVSETGSLQSGIAGIDITHEPGLKRVLKITSGKLDDLTEPNSLLLFEQQAKKLNVKVGDAITFSAQTSRGVNNTADVHVVAIAQDLGLLSGWTTFVPVKTLRDLYQQNEDSTGALLIYLKNIEDSDKVAERLRSVLPAAGFQVMDKDPRAYFMKFESVNREAWTGQKLDVTIWADEVSFMNWILLAIQALGDALLFILLVVIAVGVMNTLWIAIRERTREIGTLRSIGMQRGRVIVMFVTESLVLSTVATFVGAILGLLLCALLNAKHIKVPVGMQFLLMRDQLQLAIRPLAAGLGMAVIVTCTTLVSLIPSFLAARLKPVTAMSQVG